MSGRSPRRSRWLDLDRQFPGAGHSQIQSRLCCDALGPAWRLDYSSLHLPLLANKDAFDRPKRGLVDVNEGIRDLPAWPRFELFDSLIRRDFDLFLRRSLRLARTRKNGRNHPGDPVRTRVERMTRAY